MVLDEYHADDYGLNHKTNQIFKGFQYRSCGKHQDEFLQKFKFLEIKKFDVDGFIKWLPHYRDGMSLISIEEPTELILSNLFIYNRSGNIWGIKYLQGQTTQKQKGIFNIQYKIDQFYGGFKNMSWLSSLSQYYKNFDISGSWNAQYNMKNQEWVLDSLSLTDKNMGELNLKIQAIASSQYHDIFIILGLFIDDSILEQYPVKIINFDLSFDALPWVKRIMEINSKKTHQNIADTTNQWVNFYLQDMKEGSFIDKQWDDALINILKGKAKQSKLKCILKYRMMF